VSVRWRGALAGDKGGPVSHDPSALEHVRRGLFHGPREYTKSFPDLSIPQRFVTVGPRQGPAFLARVRDSLAGEPEVMLYVHLPFCFEECAFCNAFPHAVDAATQARYAESLLVELRLLVDAGVLDGRLVRCVYLGGGTPTAFSRRTLGRILDAIRASATLAEGASVTSEAHPVAVGSAARARELADLGIQRVSLGCQTFDERVLRLCNRDNPVALVERAVANVKAAGLAVNVDMMLGLPGQTIAGVERDLSILDVVRPDAVEFMRHEIVNRHAVELYRARPELETSADDLFQMVLATQAWLDGRGYEQNGHFTSDRFFPYRYHWLRETPFLSLGARARSYTRLVCYDNHEDLALYSALLDRGLPPAGRALWLSPEEQMYRSLLLRLQLRAGLDRAAFAARFGVDPTEQFAPELDHLGELACVEVDAAAVRLTALGRTFVEDVSCYVVDRAVAAVAAGQRREPHSASPSSSRIDRL
jgi:oxygen-independent coproporphyrinogen-3 oxidase